MDNPLTQSTNWLKSIDIYRCISQTTQFTWWICGESWKASILGPRSWVWSKILREFWVARSLPLCHIPQIAVATQNKHATRNGNPSFQDDVSWLSSMHTGVILAKPSLFCSPRRARVCPKHRNPAGITPNLWLRPREIPPTKNGDFVLIVDDVTWFHMTVVLTNTKTISKLYVFMNVCMYLCMYVI